MLNGILKWSIAQRWLVVIGAIIITILGSYNLTRMPLDVFPEFAPPQVEIQTEAPGLAPEEVETLVTLPLESAINGTPGVEIVRSSSAVGISVVRAIFSWDTDVYQARQLVTERLQQARSKLPAGVETPVISPIASPIGTILMYALTLKTENGATPTTDLMEVRRLADRTITNQLLAVPGVSNVVTYGGDIRQYQVLVDPAKLQAFDISLADVTQAAEQANVNGAGGFLIGPDQEEIIRGIGRIEGLEDLANSVIPSRNGVPIRLGDVAQVQIGAALTRGDGSVNGERAVILVIDKQPQADTPTVTGDVEQVMTSIKAGLPPDVEVIETFRQENFIASAIHNVRDSLRDGIIIVSVVMLLFLMNWRTAVITLSAIPLSVLIGLMIMHAFGQGINTMTLGGLAVAIGSVVDDSIVDMENCYRGLRENQALGNPKHPLQVVYDTSVEVRTSVIFSTVIIVVVFAPIFTLTGVEGRIFAPMGVAYLVSILASTFVAMTLSPALCAFLLAPRQLPSDETWIAAYSQRVYRPLLDFAIHKPKRILYIALGLFIAAMLILPMLGRVFLPEFQERSLVNAMLLYPGSSLEATNRVGLAMQDALKDDPRFSSVQLRSGRAPGDSDAAGVNIGHLDVELSDVGIQDREGSIETIREEFNKLPGVAPNVGGFISHRMDEVLSGVRSAIAIKIFGPDLNQLRQIGQEVEAAMQDIPGLVDLQLEPQVPIRQIQIQFDRGLASRYGLTVGQLAETIETAFNGRVVSQVLQQQQLFDLLVWLEPKARNNLDTISNLLIDTPTGSKIPLAQVATVSYGRGPNTINRENVSRLLVVSANVSGRDLRSVVNDIQAKIAETVTVPSGYLIQYGGQFESEERATQNLIVFGSLAFLVIAILMYFAVNSIPAMVMIMINLPLALIGGIFAIAVTGAVISVPSLVGFVTLFGVAVRNGLLLVDNYNQKFALGWSLKQVITTGSMERLVAILMTALTSALGMLPLAWGTGAGKEVLQPLAIVVLGGLFTSTALTLLVLPALYAQFGRYFLPKTALEPEIEEFNQPGQPVKVGPMS